MIAQRCGDGVGAAAAVDDLRVALADVDALRGPLGGDAIRAIVRDLADPQKIVDIQEVLDLICDIGLATPGPYGKPWREIRDDFATGLAAPPSLPAVDSLRLCGSGGWSCSL